MNEIVKRTLVTASGQELDIRTPYVVREVSIPQQMRVPLYIDGTLKSTEELAELGLTIREYTQDELDAIFYAGLYASNPDLETRVRQYATMLSDLGLEPTATLDDIMTAIEASETITDKVAFGLQAKTVYDAIVTNLEFCGSETPFVDTYEQLAKLIQYLPQSDPSDPSDPSTPEEE